MPKVLIVAKSQEIESLTEKIQLLAGCEIVAAMQPQDFLTQQQDAAHSDFIVTEQATLSALLGAQKTPEARQHIKSITHQGIRLVPVNNIYYFEAEHKYVMAHHTLGELLIEDSLNSLEREFVASFIRIHRKTLVALNKIETLVKGEDGKYYVQLQGQPTKLLVSRRQLAHLRKTLIIL